MFTQTLKERDSFPATPIWPVSNNGTQTTGAVDMSKFNRMTFLVGVSTLGSSGNLQAYVGESNFANGSSTTNITGAAITNIAVANNIATIEVRADQMTKRYLIGTTVVNTAASIVFMFPMVTEGRLKPITASDGSFVNERIVA